MKRAIIYLFFVILFSVSLVAQDTMYVHQPGGNILRIPVSQIDSVTFEYSGAIGETVVDIDGNVYPVVTIGSQKWMAGNLKVTRYNDGTPIPMVTGATEWNQTEDPAYCWYDNNEDNKHPYGAIYNWFAASQPNICPEGWHVPSDEEWTTLTTYLGGEAEAGGKLKEMGTIHWTQPNTGATNETGFTALPGGWRFNNDGLFKELNDTGRWWTSTGHEIYGSAAWYRQMKFNGRNVFRHNLLKGHGYCIRCMKD
jgi:uncharacterized protein (TIGR02145 family)